MNDNANPEVTPMCSKWQTATLVGCGEATAWESVAMRFHALTCKHCRSRMNEAGQVTRLLAARMGYGRVGALVLPARRVYVISLGVALAALALSSAYRMTLGAEAGPIGDNLIESDCSSPPSSTTPLSREDCDPPGPKKPFLKNK